MNKSIKKLFIKTHQFLFTKISKLVEKERIRFIEPAAQSDIKEDKIKLQKDIVQLEITRRCDLFSKRMSTIGMINIPLIISPFGVEYNLQSPLFVKVLLHNKKVKDMFICIACLFNPNSFKNNILNEALAACQVDKQYPIPDDPKLFEKEIKLRTKPYLECKTCGSSSSLPYMKYELVPLV